MIPPGGRGIVGDGQPSQAAHSKTPTFEEASCLSSAPKQTSPMRRAAPEWAAQKTAEKAAAEPTPPGTFHRDPASTPANLRRTSASLVALRGVRTTPPWSPSWAPRRIIGGAAFSMAMTACFGASMFVSERCELRAASRQSFTASLRVVATRSAFAVSRSVSALTSAIQHPRTIWA
jgi:hypothetical protein